ESTRIGDLRTNAHVLVEDPIAGGLLGYGPTIADPLTGEIIHGRVVMYYGNLVKYIKLTYDDIVAERRREAGAPPAQPPVDAPKEEPKEEPKDDAGLLMALKATPAASGLDAEVRKLTLESATDLRDKPRQKMNLGQMRELVRAQGYDMTRIQERYRIAQAKANDAGKAEDLLPISEVNEKADRLSTLSEHCGYPGEMANFQGAVGSAIDDVLPKGELKPWEELTDAEKVQITRLILPTTWVPTLIHELGHNLGLRHNFAGSMDKANHYTAKETEKLGLKRIMPYSSMMEYPNKEINALQVMGKYDIAALRFGYTRTVEQLDIERDADGKPKVDDEGEYVIKTAKNDAGEEVPVTVSVAVPGTLAELKAKTDPKLTFTNYEYCTDEGVGANPTCNRFDEGTTMAEVAQNLIDSYDEMYTRRNFRSGRRDFSLMNDGDYAISINRTFRGLRLFFEMYETLVTRFNIPAEAWEEEPFLADLNSAVEKAGDFYLRVMRTPDVFCSLASIDEPNEPVGLQMLYAINKRSVSCFEPAIIALAAQNGLVVHGQGGRSFRSLKAPGSENPYADQIDVRGIWIDKLLAEQSLLARRIGSPLFDGETLNFLQKPGFADKALKAFEEILDDRLTGELVVTTAQGKQVSLGAGGWPLSVTHKIVRPMDPFIRRAFSLPQGDNTTFVNELVFNVNAWMPSREHDWAARPFIRLFDVWEVSLTDSQDYDKSLRVLDLGTRRFLAGPQQAFARKIMNEMDQVRLMTQVKPADLAKILADLKKPQPPGPAPEPKPDPKQNEDRAAKQQRIAIAGLSLETFRKRVADAKDWTIEQLLEILKQAGAEGEIKERELARAVIAVSDALEIARAAKPGEEQDAKILEVVKASKKEAVVKLVIEKVISEAIVPAEPVPTETIEAKVRKLGPAPIEKFLKNGFKSERVYSDLLMVLTKSGR
ncbi:MAG: zinc-dependent metalloprotease, partial [Bacteriovoracia bacterium]